MALKINIALRLPDASRPDRYFSFRLQAGITAPPPCIYKTSSKLFVVSDIKENFRPFHKLLIKHRVIDRYFQWTYNEGHLVVFGNSFDGQEMHTEYLWFLYDLEQKAKAQGGCVHFIPGSHELMHINGKWRHEHPPYAETSSRIKMPITALYGANLELQHWLEMRNIVEKIGNLLFVHGDVFPMLNQQYTIADINYFARSAYVSLPEILPKSLYTFATAPDCIFFRYTGGSTSITQEETTTTLQKLHADTLIIGEPVLELPSVSYGGRLIKVATNYPKDNPTGLLIRKGNFLWADCRGRKEKINV